MATAIEYGIALGLTALGVYGAHKLGWLPTSKKDNKAEQTPAQKEMQNIKMKPQAQTDSFVRQPQPA